MKSHLLHTVRSNVFGVLMRVMDAVKEKIRPSSERMTKG